MKTNDPVTLIEVRAFKEGRFASESLRVIREVPLTLFLGDREVVTLLYNGENPEELAAGFFFSEGFLDRADEIAGIECDANGEICRIRPARSMEFFEPLWGKRLVTSGCGKGSIFYSVMDSIASGRTRVTSSFRIAPEAFCNLSRLAFQPTELSRRTHGVHAAFLCAEDKPLLMREDIGRHNALDKIAGRCVLDGIDRTDKILFTTGRLTSEVLIKAGRLGCPIVASRSSTTALALELAEKMGITVVGGAKGSSFHVYAGAHRFIVP